MFRSWGYRCERSALSRAILCYVTNHNQSLLTRSQVAIGSAEGRKPWARKVASSRSNRESVARPRKSTRVPRLTYNICESLAISLESALVNALRSTVSLLVSAGSVRGDLVLAAGRGQLNAGAVRLASINGQEILYHCL